jgi:hypothetical protein
VFTTLFVGHFFMAYENAIGAVKVCRPARETRLPVDTGPCTERTVLGDTTLSRLQTEVDPSCMQGFS